MEILGVLTVPTYWLVAIVVGLTSYVYYKYKYSYFSDQGIPGPTPLPLLGTAYLFFTKGFFEIDQYVLGKFGKTAGLYESGKPVLLTADEDILREVMVKDFNNFRNRVRFFDGDEILNNMMSMLEDDQWKRVRSLLTPTFSAGKLKQMTKCFNDCANSLIENFGVLADGDDRDAEMKEYFGAFTMDSIARTAFGVEVNSQQEKDNSPFVKHAKKAFDFKLTNPVMLISIFFPSLLPYTKKLGLSFFGKDTVDFFVSIIEQAVDGRKHGEKGYQDFLQLMLNAHKEDDSVEQEVEKEVTEDEIKDDKTKKPQKALSRIEVLSQAFLFFLAGYENTANTLGILMYNLALNPDCQKKVQEQLDAVLADKETVAYSDLPQLPYLDQCVQESLRLYPPAPRVDRVTASDTTLKGIRLTKGTVVAISIINRHLDPEIWPEPEKYDPDRFSPEERSKHSPFDHMPFGYGPRNCVALRLALVQVKIAAARILRKFVFSPCEKTQIPLRFGKAGVQRPEKGLWLRVDRR